MNLKLSICLLIIVNKVLQTVIVVQFVFNRNVVLYITHGTLSMFQLNCLLDLVLLYELRLGEM